MTTFLQAIEHTRQYLMTGQQDRTNVLQTAVNASIVTIQFTYELKSVVENSIISIDLEDMKVVATPSSAPGTSVTVIRGFNGSTPATHAINSIIRVSSQFSNWRIGTEINEELGDLSAPDVGLYRIVPVEFDYNPAQQGYNLTAGGLIDIWRVRFDVPGPQNDWPVLRRDEWYLDQDASLSEFPGGKQLVLRVPAFPGHTIRVSYKSSFGGPMTAVTDDVLSVTGLHDEAHDILSIGAALRLLMGRDVKRSFMESQPEPRRSDEVGTQASTAAMRALAAKYDQRIQSEVTRLAQRYPDQF